MKPREERLEMIKNANAETLLEWYNWHFDNYNPCDEERCFNYAELRKEVLRRMEKGAEK